MKSPKQHKQPLLAPHHPYMSTVLDTDEATPLAPLCTSLSVICGTSDLIESYEQAELAIRGSLSGSDSETRHYQRRWKQLGRSALKYCDLVQRAAGSTIATKYLLSPSFPTMP
jgi:hypothetical protein